MYLKNLSLVNYKNYEEIDVDFSPHINCIVGDNGVGKTNVLDAIYYLCMCKSYHNPVDMQNIRYDTELMLIKGEFERQDKTEQVYCGIKKGRKKQFKRNNKEYQKLSDHIGLLPVVMISPLDSGLILDGSEERRKYLNSVISQFDHVYLENVIQYNAILQQRNKLLKDLHNSNTEELIEVYNQQIVPLGNFIYERRVSFIQELTPVFNKYYHKISEGKEPVELLYESQLNNSDFNVLLREAFEKDKIIQYTSVGIHRDDLRLELRNRDIKKAGSQGQQKTYLVALKLAQLDFLKKTNTFNPLLLLDDIFDKFDAHRVQRILEIVSEEKFGQIFITNTNRELIENMFKQLSSDYKLFEVENAQINEVVHEK